MWDMRGGFIVAPSDNRKEQQPLTPEDLEKKRLQACILGWAVVFTFLSVLVVLLGMVPTGSTISQTPIEERIIQCCLWLGLCVATMYLPVAIAILQINNQLGWKNLLVILLHTVGLIAFFLIPMFVMISLTLSIR